MALHTDVVFPFRCLLAVAILLLLFLFFAQLFSGIVSFLYYHEVKY